jgi:hypothetical protein
LGNRETGYFGHDGAKEFAEVSRFLLVFIRYSGKDDRVGAMQGDKWLAQNTRRENTTIAGKGGTIEECQIEVTMNSEVLKSVVEDQYIGMEVIDGAKARMDAAAPHQHRHPGQGMGEHARFVPSLLRGEQDGMAIGDNVDVPTDRTAVATTDDRRAMTEFLQKIGQISDHRGLAAATQHQIADGNDWDR